MEIISVTQADSGATRIKYTHGEYTGAFYAVPAIEDDSKQRPALVFDAAFTHYEREFCGATISPHVVRSSDELGAVLGVTRRTVSRLKDKGYIQAVAGGYRTTCWSFQAEPTQRVDLEAALDLYGVAPRILGRTVYTDREHEVWVVGKGCGVSIDQPTAAGIVRAMGQRMSAGPKMIPAFIQECVTPRAIHPAAARALFSVLQDNRSDIHKYRLVKTIQYANATRYQYLCIGLPSGPGATPPSITVELDYKESLDGAALKYLTPVWLEHMCKAELERAGVVQPEVVESIGRIVREWCNA